MDNAQSKSQTVQSYPTYDLENCITVGRAVKELGGSKTPISKSLIASKLQLAADSSRLQGLIASARTFGILAGRGDYLLSDYAKRYFLPQSPQDEKLGILAFLGSPPPFENLIKRFDGNQLPDASFIANILQSEADIPKSWSARVANIFLQAAALAGAIDAGGFLRFEAKIHGANLDVALEELHEEGLKRQDETVRKLQGGQPPESRKQASSECFVWDVSVDGKIVHLETSKDLPRALWEKLEKYIAVIEPPKES